MDNYLQFRETTTVNYKVRVRNTGNVALTGISYSWTANGSAFTPTPGSCSSLPTALAVGAAPVTCTFSRQAVTNGPRRWAFRSYIVLGTATASAGGLSTGSTTGGATVKVVPAPKLAVNLKASQYRLGGDGDGTSGAPSFPTGRLILQRNTSSALPEIQNPTGWLYLTVINQGAVANNLNVTVTQNGSAITLPYVLPTSLAESGQSGDSFTCTIPRTLTATQAYSMNATATATGAIIVAGQQPTVTITTQAACAANRLIPNLIDTLTPNADGTNKTVLQAKNLWTARDFPRCHYGPTGRCQHAIGPVSQSFLPAFTCASNSNVNITVVAQ